MSSANSNRRCSSTASPRSPTTGADLLLQPMMQVLQQRVDESNSPEMIAAQAQMSRGRFAVAQCTSLVVTILFCFMVAVYALIKIEGLQDMIFGNQTLIQLLNALGSGGKLAKSFRPEASEDDTCPIN